MKNTRSYNLLVIALLIFLLIFFTVLSISVGSSKIPMRKIFPVLLGGNETTKEFQIINYVRIPRTLAAILPVVPYLYRG